MSFIKAYAAAPTYVGVGDSVPGAAMYWGTHAYNSTYAAAGGSAFDLRRSSDNATMTAVYLTTGALDTATISSWAGADNIFISKAYDGTGSGRHVIQATPASQPQLFLLGGPGGGPYIQSNGTAVGLSGVVTFAPSTGVMSVALVGLRQNSNVRGQGWARANSNNGNGIMPASAGTANRWRLLELGTGNGFLAVASDNAWHDAQGVINGASSVLAIDNTDTTGITGINTNNLSPFFAGGSPFGVMLMTYACFWDNIVLSGAQRSSIHTNDRAWPVAW